MIFRQGETPCTFPSAAHRELSAFAHGLFRLPRYAQPIRTRRRRRSYRNDDDVPHGAHLS